jgi:hypothetical protein
MEHIVRILAYDNELLSLVNREKQMRFTIPWTNVLMLSVVEGRHYICLRDGRTSYRLSEEDYHRLEAALHVKLAGNRLNDFSTNEPLHCPEI